MRQYKNMINHILHYGKQHDDRTGTGTRSVFGYQMRFDLSDGFPLLTTKKLPFRWIVEELLWMLSGSTDETELRAKRVDIWKEWATAAQCAHFGRKEGDLGPIYGHQWRNFGASYPHGVGVDQIATILEQIVNNPNSRRIILTGWDPKEATQVALPPCHTLTQFVVREGKLSAQLYQRSADAFLGVPFNIASYALLTHMLAHVTGLRVGEFIHTFGDLHIYNNHIDQCKMQVFRRPMRLPTLCVQKSVYPEHALVDLLNISYKDLRLKGYNPHPKIKGEVSV